MPEPTPTAPRAAVILLAAGEGSRVGAGTNKVLLDLAGLPVFAWTLRTLREVEYVDRVVVVIRARDREVVGATAAGADPVVGGATRHDSEWNALQALAGSIDRGEIDVVAIHDAARPLADARLFRAVIEAAMKHGGAVPVREQHALIPREPAGPRNTGLVAVQTPQAFTAGPLLGAYRRAHRDGFIGTDTASCVERYTGLAVCGVPGPAENLKVTFPEDVELADRLLVRPGAAGPG